MGQLAFSGKMKVNNVKLLVDTLTDWGFAYQEEEGIEDYGLITEAVTVRRDYGSVPDGS